MAADVEREAWIRGVMVLSVLVLAALVVVTPVLLGRPTAELVPLLIVGMSRNESYFIVYAAAAVQAYQYDLIRLTFNGSSPAVNGAFNETESYGIHRWIPVNASNASFTVGAYFVDQSQNYFQFNVTVRLERDLQNRTRMLFTFPYEKDYVNTVVQVYPPDDFRWGIPRRGTLP